MGVFWRWRTSTEEIRLEELQALINCPQCECSHAAILHFTDQRIGENKVLYTCKITNCPCESKTEIAFTLHTGETYAPTRTS
jgi:hypothetical protein